MHDFQIKNFMQDLSEILICIFICFQQHLRLFNLNNICVYLI